MPLIDVTEVLIDVDVAAQGFVVLRRQEIVNNYGESTWVTERIQAVGSVQPKGDNSLERNADFDAQANSIVVATTFRLRGVSKGPNNEQFKPDIIFWQGNYFEVKMINNWSPFGAGFIEAEASSIHNIDFPPDGLPANVGKLDFSRGANAVYAHGASGGI